MLFDDISHRVWDRWIFCEMLGTGKRADHALQKLDGSATFEIERRCRDYLWCQLAKKLYRNEWTMCGSL